MTTFEEQLQADDNGLAVEDLGSDLAIMAFGGLKGALAIPAFEFFGLTKDLPVTKVFVRDLASSWYAEGVRGLGDDLAGVARGAQQLTGSLKVDPVLFGGSAGGFAAIAVALMNDFPEVHAFGPQVSLRRKARQRLGDTRWSPRVRALRAVPGSMRDLRPVFDRQPRSRTHVHVHVAADEPLDIAHAELIADRPNVTIHEHAAGGHAFVRQLRKTGELEEIIRRAMEETRARRRTGIARRLLGPVRR